MAVKLISPASIFSLTTGATLPEKSDTRSIASISLNVLGRIRWINYNSVVRLVVFHKIGVVVAGSSPCKYNFSKVPPRRRTKSQPFILHMGMDWICMARVKASFRQRQHESIKSREESE